jgi:hypothetical protein
MAAKFHGWIVNKLVYAEQRFTECCCTPTMAFDKANAECTLEFVRCHKQLRLTL